MYLVNSNFNLGIFLRIKEKKALNPYAAPFGGILSKDNRTEYTKVNEFISDLIAYLTDIGIKKLQLVFPAPFYGCNATTKVINSLIQGKFSIKLTPEINNHVPLVNFDVSNYPRNINEIIRKTSRHALTMNEVHDDVDKLVAYNIVKENKKIKSRTMSILYSHLRSLDEVCGARYFLVRNSGLEPVASAITFKTSNNIIYTQFWGDNLIGRDLNAMDYLFINMTQLFKDEGWLIMDLGISSQNGLANSGLLRFKESHLAESTLRFSIDVTLD